jgi:hypothetical protein
MRLVNGVTLGLTFLCATFASVSFAEKSPSKAHVPDRSQGEGPFKRMVLRGGFLIDGSGAPTLGPVDIVIEGDRIAEIRTVSAPGLPINPKIRPKPGDFELDVSGAYIMPGLINMHSHIHSSIDETVTSGQNVPPEYVLKLLMGHGITTIREVGNARPIEWLVDLKRRSEANEIIAPRIFPYIMFGRGAKEPIDTPDQARAHIRNIKKRGGVGVKFLGSPPEILWAALDECKKQGLRTTMHHSQFAVAQANVLDTSAHGLDCMEHWYGLPEAMFHDRVIQDYSLDYVYTNEQDRFGEAGRLWQQAAPPFSDKWNAVMNTLLDRDFSIVPTFSIYAASRDWMRMRRAEWHDEYTMPQLWDFFRPDRNAHGSYFFNWGVEEEVAWRENYRLWMSFINEYKNRGGRVAVGEDAGYIYQTYGFGYIMELELLREAGFHPLEVIHAATRKGAEILGLEDEIGTVQVGRKADLCIVSENPLANLKVLYGTGHLRLNDDTRKVERVGGVQWTIKDGILYNAKDLLSDVREMVRTEKDRLGIPPGPMPVENAQ